ncbi:hypothetical protein CKO38_02425 [Rhodospirillum rubrum]|uniref:hypothetical protein n=1 Tax=Rhodospirillum rubrum TaxID=1085 RepID=UPI0019083370|nr:hypothetical protein [Rhodospirillum rubrum]MBK1663374.1 hypothetical protein [Rhodospirillum rubrum]MBK1675546.1 hypothetical protein [Rhodospirillum rubrum]
MRRLPTRLLLSLGLAAAPFLAWAEVPTPSPLPPADPVVPISGSVSIGDAPVSDAPRLLRAVTDFSQGGGPGGHMEVRFSSFVSKTSKGDTLSLRMRGDDLSMQMPGLPPLPTEEMQAIIRQTEVLATADKRTGKVTVQAKGTALLGPVGTSLEQFARVMAKAFFGGRTVRQGETILTYTGDDLGVGAPDQRVTVSVTGKVTGRASAGGRDYVVINGGGPISAANGAAGSVEFTAFIDRATGLPAWSETNVSLDMGRQGGSMKMHQVDEIYLTN